MRVRYDFHFNDMRRGFYFIFLQGRLRVKSFKIINMFKEIVGDFKEGCVWFSNWLFYKRMSVKMGLAIRLADVKQRAYNKQYHIMLLALPTGEKLVSLNKNDMARFKRKKWLPKNMSFFDLKHSDSIFYSTPLDRNNKSSAKERKEAREKYLKYAKKYFNG